MSQPNPRAYAGRSVRYSAERREHAFDVNYDAFTRGLESLFSAPVSGTAPSDALAGFSLLSRIDHGPARGVTYLFESSSLAPRMKQREQRAALYLPLRLYVGAIGAEQTLVTYDVPSSVFAQLASADVDAFAALLDAELYALVLDAAELAGGDLRD